MTTIIKKFDKALEDFFYSVIFSEHFEYSSSTLEQKIEQGLDGILNEIYENIDDFDSMSDEEILSELKDRLETSCKEYNFPHDDIKKLNL